MAFTAKQVIDIYLFRWQMQDMATECLRYLTPKLGMIDRLVGEKGKARWDEKVNAGQPIKIRAPEKYVVGSFEWADKPAKVSNE